MCRETVVALVIFLIPRRDCSFKYLRPRIWAAQGFISILQRILSRLPVDKAKPVVQPSSLLKPLTSLRPSSVMQSGLGIFRVIAARFQAI